MNMAEQDGTRDRVPASTGIKVQEESSRSHGPGSRDPPPNLQLPAHSQPPARGADQLANSSHCCLTSYILESSNRRFRNSPKCLCSGGHTSGQILRTSRQIYDEAMPVLYKNMELRIPFTDDVHYKGAAYLSDRLRKSVPAGALPAIKYAQIICRLNKATSEAIGADGRALANIRNCWRLLGRELPKLRYLRLHIDIFPGSFVDQHARVLQFTEVVKLQALQTVAVCVDAPSHEELKGSRKAVRRFLVKYIKERIEVLGKSITVLED